MILTFPDIMVHRTKKICDDTRDFSPHEHVANIFNSYSYHSSSGVRARGRGGGDSPVLPRPSLPDRGFHYRCTLLQGTVPLGIGLA